MITTLSGVMASLLIFLSLCAVQSDCSEAEGYASDAYTYARKAYRAESLRELRDYARKAKGCAEQAHASVQACKCEDALTFADDAASYARKAERSDNFDEAVNYSKKALRAAEDLELALSECSNDDDH